MRLHVVVRLAERGSEQRKLVHVRRHVRKDLGHVHPALPVLLELEWARHQRAGMTLSDDDVALARQAADRRKRFNAGLGSNVSTWLTPPLMNSEMTLFARAGICGFLAGIAPFCPVLQVLASRLSAFSSHASPSPLMPPHDSNRNPAWIQIAARFTSNMQIHSG